MRRVERKPFVDGLPYRYSVEFTRYSFKARNKIVSVIDSISSSLKALLIKHLRCRQLCNPDPISGLYPIHLAVKNTNLSAIKYLLKADIPLNVLDQDGNTVHHYAAETNKDIVSVMNLAFVQLFIICLIYSRKRVVQQRNYNLMSSPFMFMA